MAGFAASRRRLIARFGRPMVLSRPNDAAPPAPLAVTGTLSSYAPERIAPPKRQGDAEIQLGADELAGAARPKPDLGTWVLVDGVTWAVQGANPVYDGAALIGWALWVRGGEP